jgi:hypothetical protein
MVFAQARVGHPVAAIPLVEHWQTFTDPNEGAFDLEMPQGWKLSGGTLRRTALQYRTWASAISPDGETILAINDPLEGSYVTPSPMLAMAGFQPGSVYDGGGGNKYVVAPYQSGAQFAAAWGQRQLPAHCSSIKVTSSRPLPELAQKLNAYLGASGLGLDYGEALFSCDKNGMPMTAYVFSRTLMIRTAGQYGLWYADMIEAFLAPAPVAGVAAGLLAHMVKTARLNPSWEARQSQTNMDVSRIATQTNAAISDTVMRSWEQKGAIIDSIMEKGSRERLGIDVYEDKATGTRYTVANTSNSYWLDAKGNILGSQTTDAPAGAVKRLDHVPAR